MCSRDVQVLVETNDVFIHRPYFFTLASVLFCSGVGSLEAKKAGHGFESCIIYALSASGCNGCNRLSPVNKHIDVLPPSKRLNQRNRVRSVSFQWKQISFLLKVRFTLKSVWNEDKEINWKGGGWVVLLKKPDGGRKKEQKNKRHLRKADAENKCLGTLRPA